MRINYKVALICIVLIAKDADYIHVYMYSRMYVYVCVCHLYFLRTLLLVLVNSWPNFLIVQFGFFWCLVLLSFCVF